MQYKKILCVDELTVTEKKTAQTIINKLTFTVRRNSYLGVFGPSGSGKTTLLSALMRICPAALATNGEIMYLPDENKELLIQRGQTINKDLKLSQDLSYIPQNAIEMFDPIEKMGTQFEETFYENSLDKSEIKDRITELLEKMDLPESILSKYPFQLSGGMLQRCAIGLTLVLRPKVVVADEPTAALDSITKKRVIALFSKLKKEKKMTLILATHDIALLDFLCDEVLIVVKGEKIIQKNLYPIDVTDQSYLGKVRKTKQKLSANFERLKHEKLARN